MCSRLGQSNGLNVISLVQNRYCCFQQLRLEKANRKWGLQVLDVVLMTFLSVGWQKSSLSLFADYLYCRLSLFEVLPVKHFPWGAWKKIYIYGKLMACHGRITLKGSNRWQKASMSCLWSSAVQLGFFVLCWLLLVLEMYNSRPSISMNTLNFPCMATQCLQCRFETLLSTCALCPQSQSCLACF